MGPTIPEGSGSRALRLDWHEAPSSDFVGLPGDQKILGGVDTSTGFLVYGYTSQPRTPGVTPDLDTAAWVGDAEGQDWDPVQSVSFVAHGSQRAAAAVVFGDDAIVLAGSDQSNGNFDGAAWILPAGSMTWARADLHSAGLDKQQDQKIRAVVRSAPFLFAVGYTASAADEDAVLWQSKLKGKRWTFAQGGVPSEEATSR